VDISQSPQLEVLAVQGCFDLVYGSLMFTNLRHAELRSGGEDMFPTVGQCLTLLRIAPHLEKFVVYLGYEETVPNVHDVTEIGRLLVAHLSSIRLRAGWQQHHITSVLDSITTPSLRRINLRYRALEDYSFANGAIDKLLHFIQRSNAPLEELYIQGHRGRNGLVMDRLIRILPVTLRKLELINVRVTAAGILALTLQIPGGDNVCPNLEHISLFYCFERDVPGAARLLEGLFVSRWDISESLSLGHRRTLQEVAIRDTCLTLLSFWSSLKRMTEDGLVLR